MDKLLLVGCWLVCPIVLPFVLSDVMSPIYHDRYTISAAPALYLLLASGIASVRKVVPEIVTLGALVIVIAPGLHHYYVTDVKEQWREVAQYVEENAGRDDAIVFAPDENGWQQKSFYWYYRGSLPGCGIDVRLMDDASIENARARCTSGAQRFWLVMRGTSEVVGRFKAWFLNRNHADIRLIREQQFKGISIYLFEVTRQ
jgi:mannosyltransferase